MTDTSRFLRLPTEHDGPVRRAPIAVLASLVTRDEHAVEAFLEHYGEQPYVIAAALAKRPTDPARKFLKSK